MAAVAGLPGVAQAEADPASTVRAGRVVAWGDNTFGQTAVPSGLDNVVAVSAGAYHGLALRSDGTVVAWGAEGKPGNGKVEPQARVPAGLRDVVAIAAGPSFSAALRRDGEVVVWPKSSLCEMTPPPGVSKFVALAAGDNHLVGLREDGTVAAWGHSEDAETLVPPGLVGVRSIAAARTRNWALRHDGSVVGWGADHLSNYDGPRAAAYSCDQGVLVPLAATYDDVPRNAHTSGPSSLTAIAAGTYALLRLEGDGDVVAAGNSRWCPLRVPERLKLLALIDASKGSSQPHGLALQTDGTVVSWGCEGEKRPVPRGLRNVVAISAGDRFDVAITTDQSDRVRQ